LGLLNKLAIFEKCCIWSYWGNENGPDPEIRIRNPGAWISEFSFGKKQKRKLQSSVADPHHFHVDPDADPEPACHFDADPDASFLLWCDPDADPDPACHFDADPDPSFHSDADPDPSFQIKKDQNLEKLLKYYRLKIQHILACHLQIDADPDPAYHFNADPDPAYHFDADPDPNFQSEADPCGSGSTTLRQRLTNSIDCHPKQLTSLDWREDWRGSLLFTF
jgi:hypothetical protein